MRRKQSARGLSLLAAVVIGLALAAVVTNVSAQTTRPPQQQPPPRLRLVGTIAVISAGEFSMTGRDGQRVTVRIASDTRIFGRIASRLADIAAGDRVLVVARKAQDGSLTALTVLDSPADLTRGGHSGTREIRSGRVLVRGTAVSVGGTSLSIATGNASATSVAVPPTARIQRVTVLLPSSLSAGMRVAVGGTTNPDGAVTASVIIVSATARR